MRRGMNHERRSAPSPSKMRGGDRPNPRERRGPAHPSFPSLSGRPPSETQPERKLKLKRCNEQTSPPLGPTLGAAVQTPANPTTHPPTPLCSGRQVLLLSVAGIVLVSLLWSTPVQIDREEGVGWLHGGRLTTRESRIRSAHGRAFF